MICTACGNTVNKTEPGRQSLYPDPPTHLHSKWLPQPLQKNLGVLPRGLVSREHHPSLGVRPEQVFVEYSQ